MLISLTGLYLNLHCYTKAFYLNLHCYTKAFYLNLHCYTKKKEHENVLDQPRLGGKIPQNQSA